MTLLLQMIFVVVALAWLAVSYLTAKTAYDDERGYRATRLAALRKAGWHGLCWPYWALRQIWRDYS